MKRSANKQSEFRAKSAQIAYKTKHGVFFEGKAEDVLQSKLASSFKGKVDLIFTSPPFPLNRKKQYGNLNGQEYIEWLKSFAQVFRDFLRPTGSIVMELGNAWEDQKPVMSTLGLQALLAFLNAGKLYLCQQFVWHNPARLPSPAQWVNENGFGLKTPTRTYGGCPQLNIQTPTIVES
jgi:site-specific DNA-methyltransferase (cytosine-N4-specific)